MGMGKGSSTSSVQMTPEQQQLLQAQTGFLTGTAFPAYQNTIGGAGQVYNVTNPAATTAAQTAMDVAQQAGALQQQAGTGAYQSGLANMSNMAGVSGEAGQQALGAGMSGVGALGQSQGLTGAALQGAGAQGLASLFSPQYKQEQISAAMQPAREEIRNQLAGQNAMFGGAGGLGSSRQALADRNLSQLGQQRMATAAATASGNVEAQRQQAATSLLGAGQTALGQAGGLYQNLLGAGQGLTGAAGQLYGNLANMGQQGLTGAQQAAASRIGYAGTPQDVYSKYASVIYGTPQGSTTPSFQGTQGTSTASSGKGFKI